MLIGAAGTIILNLTFGFASFVGTFSTMALIWLLNGWFQSFGAPGMVKIDAAWFNRDKRGTFAGIFGFMIQSGQFAINNLAPVILAGFAIGTWVVAPNDWRWLFRLPPIMTAIMAVLLVCIPKESPEQAGYPGIIAGDGEAGADIGVRTSVKESFVAIFTHPLVWFYPLAYACTGAVRNSSDQLAVELMQLYKQEKVNPMGRCLPIVAQMPILFAAYTLFANAIELRHAPFMLWIHDLSLKDPTYITPILMTASMVLQQKLSPQVGDPAQRRMFMLMPFIFGLMFMSFPAGLVLYWLVNNILTIAQQLATVRLLRAKPATT